MSDDAEPRSRDRVQSIERAVAVLRVFDRRTTRLSVGEIATRTELPRPVVRRILITFEHLGYVRSQRGVWELTPRILELGAAYFAESSLPEIAAPVMDDVVARLGETCSLGALNGADVIHVARSEDHRPLPGAVRVGMSLPAVATAIGKVLLAALPERELDRLLATIVWEAHTPNTLSGPDALRERLERVRHDGFDVSVEELNAGMVAAAVPIQVAGMVVGGLGISSTTLRLDERQLREESVPVLQQAAARIAQAYRAANPSLRVG